MRRFWIIVLVWLGISCNEIRDCELAPGQDFVVIAFYEADSVEKFRKDTLIFQNFSDTLAPEGQLNAAGLVLNPAQSTITYPFVTDSLIFELWVSYTRQVEIYSEECDPVFLYTLDSIYSPNFDSVRLIAGPVDKAISVNIEIYF